MTDALHVTTDLPIISLDQQIAAVAREVAMREKCYPKWVAEKRMLQSTADHQLSAMKAVLTTLKNLKENPNAAV